ncbi:MAG: hypothetical protein ACFBSD_07405 [Paracoccaceae bacterium]
MSGGGADAPMPPVWARAAGAALVAALAWGAWEAYAGYAAFARIDQWTGQETLRPLRPWLTELRWPLLGIGGVLVLSLLSGALKRLGLGS